MKFRRLFNRPTTWFTKRQWFEERLIELSNEPRPRYATGSIYRFWTADCSVLLYLGRTKGDEPTLRMKGHVEKHRLARAGYCNREWVTGDVPTAEAIRISYEEPRHNAQHPSPQRYGAFDQSLRSYRKMVTSRLKKDGRKRSPEAGYWRRIARKHPKLVMISRPSRPDRDHRPDLDIVANGDLEGSPV
jgi:hypothetical protein